MAKTRCKQCGNWVSDSKDWCTKCGAPISKMHPCPRCGFSVYDEDALCPRCGYRLREVANQYADHSSNVIDYSVRKTPKNNNRQVYFISAGVLVVALLIMGLLLVLLYRNNGGGYYGGGGSASSSSSSLNSNAAYFKQEHQMDEGNYSSGNIHFKFEKELIKERDRMMLEKYMNDDSTVVWDEAVEAVKDAAECAAEMVEGAEAADYETTNTGKDYNDAVNKAGEVTKEVAKEAANKAIETAKKN